MSEPADEMRRIFSAIQEALENKIAIDGESESRLRARQLIRSALRLIQVEERVVDEFDATIDRLCQLLESEGVPLHLFRAETRN